MKQSGEPDKQEGKLANLLTCKPEPSRSPKNAKNAPQAFIGLLQGESFGKLVVGVGSDKL